MADLATPADCRRLVDHFYALVREDTLLGPIFNCRVDDWEDHLDTMARFWSSIVFSVPLYHGHPVIAHRGLPLEPAHFARWLALWRTATGDLFAGPAAADVVERAERIAVALARRLQEEAP